MRIGSLFSGYGGLDMAAESVFGARTAWVSDIDKGARKVLAHRYPDVPNLGDITRIDWSQVEPVDIITGGSPCQDLSAAGRRAGMTEGTRSNLWVAMREAIAHVQPTFVVWENVRGAFSARAASDLEHCAGCMGDPADRGPVLRALGRVLGDLAELGFDAEWRGVRASEVGACHQRFRVFVLAWRRGGVSDDSGGGGGHETVEHDGRGPQAGDWAGVPYQPDRHVDGFGPDGGLTLLPSPRTSDTNGAGAHGSGGPDLRTVAATLPTPRATDGTKGGPNQRGGSGDLMLPSAVAQLLPTPRAEERMQHNSRDNHMALSAVAQLLPTPTAVTRDRTDDEIEHRRLTRTKGLNLDEVRATEFGHYAAAIARQEAAFGYPAPSPTEPGKNRPRLSARFAEWMMGLPAGWITDVPGVTRNEALKLCGNGVVWQQAAAALVDMLAAMQQEVAA